MIKYYKGAAKKTPSSQMKKNKKNIKTRGKKKPVRKGRSVSLGRISKITGVLAAVLILLYSSVGYTLDKGFIKRDLNEKFGKVLGATATTLTLKVIGPPNKPVLTATPVCVNYVPYVNLSWTADDQMDYFDLERGGAPLVAGITKNTYQDVAVSEKANYSYTVTAFNPLGQNTSDAVSATVLDCGTSSPVLTATPVCKNYIPYVDLFWTSEQPMDYFDLKKDGALLAGGLTATEYEDGTVEALKNYTYFVTGFNLSGHGISNVVSATALDCTAPPPPPSPSPPPPPPVLPDPTCVITKFQNINLSSFHGTPSSKERRPKFYGTTNMPNAQIDIVISGKTSVIAKTSANENGFWMWSPPDKLNFGLNKIEATAVDPNDPTRKKTASLDFRIENAESGGGGEKENAPTASTGGIAPSIPSETVPVVVPPTQKIPSSEISVRVTNPDKIAYPGRDLSVVTEIKIEDGTQPFDSDLKYSIVDENYDEVFQTPDWIHIDGTKTIEKNLNLPRLLKPGKYKVVVSFSQDGVTLVAEDSFLLKEVPLVNLGGGATITATQIMSNLFWVIFWILILLIIFLILLEIEYWISKRAIIQITEETLRGKGLITRKKIR